MSFPRLLCILILSACVGSSEEWQTLNVPGSWTSAFGNTDSAPTEVNGWYRCWVQPPKSYFTPHERNLFEESIGIHLSELVGDHELWVNGLKIGAGSYYPNSDSPTKTISTFRHKIPVGTLKPDRWNEIAIRLSGPSEGGGFTGEAPFIMDYFLECVFDGKWEFLSDSDYLPGRAVIEKPTRATFDQFRESQRTLARTEAVRGPSLPPAESASKMESAPDLRTDLLLHEPTVTQPFHFTFDERGRLWVAQSRQYPFPAGLEMLSRDKYYRAHYDTIPAAPPNHTPGADRITIHEDTDGDGVYDLHKTFVEGLNLANSAIRGYGGVWIMHTPHLMFYPDANGDDIPDGAPEVKLTGFGFEDTHSISNGLTWGPDGWLYGGQGSTCSCRVTRPGIDPPDAEGVYFEGCMVWRYHPETKAFEIFAEGGGNTYGLEFDAEGRLYSGHNGGDTRGWHFVQGGFYQMQGVNPGKFGPPRNPYAFGELPMMSTSNRIVRFSHIGAFVEGSALPDKYHGQLFAIDPLHNEVIAAQRLKLGSTFSTLDQGVVVKSSDPAFRPIHIANAPDGSIVVSDMYEYYIAHGQHYQNQIDRTTGRIYRITGKDSHLLTDINLAEKSETELIQLLGHPNKWHRQTAVRLLGERKNSSVFQELRRLAVNGPGVLALNALWALHQAGGLDFETIQQSAQSQNAHVRLWTVRLLGDTYGIHRNLGLPGDRKNALDLPADLMAILREQALKETDAEARSQMASTARRLTWSQGLELIQALLQHDEDLEDLYIPMLCWWFFEAHLPERAESVVEFFESAHLWERAQVKERLLPRIARRLAVDGKRQNLLLLARLIRSAPAKESASALLSGYEQAFRGRAIPTIPDELASALDKLNVSSLVLRLRQKETDAYQEAVAMISNQENPLAERILYVRILGETKNQNAPDVLFRLAFSDPSTDLRKTALSALGSFSDINIAEKITEQLPTFPEAARSSALTLLTSRKEWTHLLLSQIENGSLKSEWLSSEITDLLRTHPDSSIQSLAMKLFPDKRESGTATRNSRVQEIETILKSGTGDPYQGESIYMQRCAACHTLFYKGGSIGPDLTSYQRKDLGTLLPSILDPNAEIREGYEYIQIETRDDRLLSGFEVDRDLKITVLRGLDGQDVVVENNSIQSIKSNNRSLMPEGLLDGLNEQQLRDFFAYLRISQPFSR